MDTTYKEMFQGNCLHVPSCDGFQVSLFDFLLFIQESEFICIWTPPVRAEIMGSLIISVT